MQFKRTLPLLAGLFLFAFLWTQGPVQAATTLVAGDIAIIGYNFDNPDEFAFVALENIDVGAQISFTDNGWLNSGSFRSGEGTFTWTAPATICAGEVVIPSISGVAFAADGDQILAYQGNTASPTFIYALESDGIDTTWAADASTSNTSALPTGLTNGTTAVAIPEIDNAVYIGTTTGTRASLLAAISNPANWAGSDSSRQTMPTGPYTVTDAASCGSDVPPQISSITPTNSAFNISVNSTITLNFDETVDLTSSAVTLECPVLTSIAFSGLPANDVSSVVLTPDSLLPENTICTVTAVANQITDNDGNADQLDGNGDGTAGDNYSFTFTTASPVTSSIIINEVDSDTPGADAAEFVELYDGGSGNTSLDGFVLVFFNGSNDLSYASFDLEGYTTNAAGYFVLGNAAVLNVDRIMSNGLLQNGADAVALYQDDAASFPSGTAVTTTNLIDAIVYGTGQANDTGLLPLLNASQPQVNENANSSSDVQSNQRCANGTGGLRNTSTYAQNAPTPGLENFCGTCNASVTPISTIQGSGANSPLSGSTGITIRGTVVGDFQASGKLGGFFVQDSGDGDPLTSDGIFVFSTATDVIEGQVVEVTGTIVEYNGLTEISPVTSINTCGVALIAETAVSLPLTAISDLESYEGMLVTFAQDLTVTEHFTLGRYGTVLLSSGGHLMNPTQVADPGVPATAVLNANLLNQILIDDASTVQNPDPIIYPAPGLSAANTLRTGSTVSGLTGVMSYAFGEYTLQPTLTPSFATTNPRTVTPPDVGGNLKVASFNVLNYFNGDGLGGGFPTSRGANNITEFNRQRAKIISAISALDADIVGLMEIENDGYGANSAIQDLVNGLNTAAGGPVWAFIDPSPLVLGSDEITVGFIYKTASVSPVDSATTLSTGAFAARNRQPLVQTFITTSDSEKFTVAVNHFKSKSTSSNCNDALGVFPADPNTGDGQGDCNLTRTMAASQLAAWLATDPTSSNDPDFIIMGDLNAYAREDPIKTLKNAGYTNLFASFDQNSYSYVFDGAFGTLDYILGNMALTAQVTGAAAWHINADEPNSLDYNTEFKNAGQLISLYAADAYRASDHDPVIIGLDLDSTVEADFSDLDTVYNTAWHTGSGAIRLGSMWDADSTFAANNDNPSDDGVTVGLGTGSGGQWQPGTDGASLNIEVTGGSGCLYTWIDWNGDGLFDDSENPGNLEYAIRSVPVNAGTANYAFDVPANEFQTPPGDSLPLQSYNVRVRLYETCSSGPTGAAVNGEVEDYTFTFSPTAVTLQSIHATSQNNLWLPLLLILVVLMSGGLFVWQNGRSHPKN